MTKVLFDKVSFDGYTMQVIERQNNFVDVFIADLLMTEKFRVTLTSTDVERLIESLSKWKYAT